VQRRDAVAFDRRPVLGGGVADVGGELPPGVTRLHPLHEAVARDLGDHRRRGDRGAHRVAAHDRALLEARRRDWEAVGQAQAAVAAHARENVAQRGQVRLVEPTLVDAAHAPRRHRDARGGAEHARVERLAHLGRVLLGVVQLRQGAQVAQGQRLVVEQDRRGDERACEAAAAGLVGAGHEPGAESAVEPEEARARRAPLGLAGAAGCGGGGAGGSGVRGARCAWAASRWQRRRR
jgi:hypothetical protein